MTPLHGLRVLDLSRILAGPTCTQLLGDLGADVIKVERPGHGDDTRSWGPPFVKDVDGRDTSESAYYLCANRNKRSIAVDFAKPEGAALIRTLASECDVLLENYKVGTLAKHGLGYADLEGSHPHLIYCSISGFGQTGPRANEPGYDFLVQAMGGIMSLTGEPTGQPMKVGVGVADLMCGMYAAVGILAALQERHRSGRGQHIDVALLDSQVAWLINGATNYLTSGKLPQRLGNAHPNVVPYQVFPTKDAHIIIAVGNDGQFARACRVLGLAELSNDARFNTNTQRIRNRDELIKQLKAATMRRTTEEWVHAFGEANVPAGPVNTLDKVFADPQIAHRNMRITMRHSVGTTIDLLGNPINMSRTKVHYHRPPPVRAEHTAEVLQEHGISAAQVETWRKQHVIE